MIKSIEKLAQFAQMEDLRYATPKHILLPSVIVVHKERCVACQAHYITDS